MKLIANKSIYFLLLMFFSLSCILNNGCNGIKTNYSDTGSIKFSLNWNIDEKSDQTVQDKIRALSGNVCDDYLIETVSATVFKSSDVDGNNLVADTREFSCESHGGTISAVPIGEVYVVVEGAVSGLVTWRGQSNTVTVRAGETTMVKDIVMVYIGSDIEPPYVLSKYPSPEETGISIGANITIQFNEQMIASLFDAEAISIEEIGGDTVIGEISYNSNNYTVTYDPTSNLLLNTEYMITLSTALADISGNTLGQEESWSFTTEAGAANILIWDQGNWNESNWK